MNNVTTERQRCYVILMALSLLSGGILPALAEDSSALSKQAQNPITNLVSVPFENDFNPETGIYKRDSYVLQVKPVVPFRLSEDWTVITRTIVPVIQIPDLAPGVRGVTGLGDIQESAWRRAVCRRQKHFCPAAGAFDRTEKPY